MGHYDMRFATALFLAVFCVSQSALGTSVFSKARISNCVLKDEIAITFDEGPSPVYTNTILDILKTKKVKVVFHVFPDHLDDPSYQAIIKRATAEGHLIGLRSSTAWDLEAMDDKELRNKFTSAASLIKKITGTYPLFVRLPYQLYTTRVRDMVEALGFVITEHSLETADYATPDDPAKILENIQSVIGAFNGPQSHILTFHDFVSANTQVLPQLIDFILNKDLSLVRLDRCFGLSGNGLDTPPNSPDSSKGEDAGSNGKGDDGNNGGSDGKGGDGNGVDGGNTENGKEHKDENSDSDKTEEHNDDPKTEDEGKKSNSNAKELSNSASSNSANSFGIIALTALLVTVMHLF